MPFRRAFQDCGSTRSLPLILGPLPQVAVLLLALFLVAGGGPVRHASAADGPPPVPDENGTVRDDGGDAAKAVARAAALYGQFKSSEALVELKKALALSPDDPEVLVWTARTYIDVGDMIPETVPDWEKKRQEQYRTAERYARAAVKVDPKSTWPHFFLAVSLGKVAEFSGVKKQIALAGDIREATDTAIALDPDNGFAYHVLGVWHRRMAEINQAERLLAKLFLLGSVPPGRMDDSVRYLKKAIGYNPDVINHHLELARTYQALGKPELARRHLETVAELPIKFSDDAIHKRKAQQLLQEISRNGGG